MGYCHSLVWLFTTLSLSLEIRVTVLAISKEIVTTSIKTRNSWHAIVFFTTHT
jgi:hypothetical protein